MDKEELIQLLKEYKENKAKKTIKLKELKSARIQLKYCDDTDTSLTSCMGINQDIQSKNKVSNKVLERVEKNDTKREKIEEKIANLEIEIRELVYKVETVEDRLEALKFKEGKLLKAYYIEGRTYDDIGNNIYLELFSQTRDKDSIKRTVERALQKMLKI